MIFNLSLTQYFLKKINIKYPIIIISINPCRNFLSDELYSLRAGQGVQLEKLQCNLMTKESDKEYYLTRGQYAQKINKTKGAVIQSMRRGGLQNEFIVKDGKYYFRNPNVALRANQESKYVPMYTPKKKYNRGNHDNANYPNAAFKLRNEIKRLAAIQHKVPKDIQEQIPAAIEKIKQERRNSLRKELKPTKNYGGFLTSYELNRDKFKSTNKGIAIRKKGPYEI